jgi:hypothetical protein
MKASPVIQAGSERPRQEEVQACVDLASGHKADPQHHREVDGQDGVVDRTRIHLEHPAPPESVNYENSSPPLDCDIGTVPTVSDSLRDSS